MTPEELRELMTKHGHNNRSLAELVEIHRNTVSRWLNGKTPIDAANALLIRDRLKTKRK